MLARALVLFALAALPFDARAAGDAVDADRAMRDLASLAADDMEGRAAGTPGGEKAAAFIEARFAEIGLKPVRQTFEFTAGVAIGPGSAMRIDPGGAPTSLAVREDFSPLGFSANGRAAAPIVFCGYGITAPEAHYDDYAAIDARGKIALVFDRVPRHRDAEALFKDGLVRYSQVRYKAMNAREHGAAAMIVVASRADDPSLLAPTFGVSHGDAGILVVDLKRAHAERLVAAGGRTLAALAELIDCDLAPHSIELGPARAEIVVEVVKEKRETANVLAVLEGADPKLREEVIVLGAHYDHLGRGEAGGSLAEKPGKEIHNGADDNASGTAALLEAARALRAGPPPRRTVVFAAFGAEELGLLGSAHYTKEPLRPLDRTVAMINMDMVGRMKGRRISIGGAGTSDAWPPLVRNAAEALGLEPTLDDEGYGPSDHSTFYGKGVPVLFLFTGAHEDYHKPSDDAERIAKEGFGLAVRLAVRLVRAIDALDERPAWKKTRGTPHGRELEPGRGPTVYFGTIPDYADTEKPGVRLAGVREGSPAERAGLRNGDRIVRFDGKEIRDVQDYTYALFAKKPGDVVKLVIERDGTTLELEATLGRKGGGLPAGHPPVEPGGGGHEGGPGPQK